MSVSTICKACKAYKANSQLTHSYGRGRISTSHKECSGRRFFAFLAQLNRLSTSGILAVCALQAASYRRSLCDNLAASPVGGCLYLCTTEGA
jgi:hypothetical protein